MNSDTKKDKGYEIGCKRDICRYTGLFLKEKEMYTSA
jgi:hypothetical protein